MKQSNIFLDFHRSVRIVYRYFRKTRGKEWTQDECLKLFKIVFPEKFRAFNSEGKFVCMSDKALERMAFLFDAWHPQGVLHLLCEYTLTKASKPMEKEDFLRFCDDILPVVMRIRKLTPRECFRLMDVSEPDIDKMLGSELSNSVCYKLAGNSICVGVMTAIFDKLFVNTDLEKVAGTQLSLF